MQVWGDDMDREITAWVTKYALTQGILKVDGKVDGEYALMLEFGEQDYAHSNNWHRTEKAALERAEEMRISKIASLKKSLAKMESLKIKVVT